MCSTGYSASISVSKSKEGVVAPNLMVATYSLVWYWKLSISLVFLPVHRIITPVARGSKVPACPTLSFFTPICLLNTPLTLFTRLKEVQPKGLSKYKTVFTS